MDSASLKWYDLQLFLLTTCSSLWLSLYVWLAFLETRHDHKIVLFRVVAAAGAEETKKRGNIMILPQYLLVASSDLQHKHPMGEYGIPVFWVVFSSMDLCKFFWGFTSNFSLCCIWWWWIIFCWFSLPPSMLVQRPLFPVLYELFTLSSPLPNLVIFPSHFFFFFK